MSSVLYAFRLIYTGALERTGGQGVDYAVGTFFSPQIVSVAYRVAQILRVALDNDWLGRA